MSVYEELLSKCGLDKSELDSKIEQFSSKNPDLNKEICAFFVAKELGVEIDDSKLVITPLNLLDESSKNANILVYVERAFPKKEFNSQNNKSGNLQNVIVTDNTCQMQLTLWNQETELNRGDVVLVTNIYVNVFKDEKKLNTSKFSSIKIKDSQRVERVYNEKKLYELQDKDTNLSVTGIIKSKSEIKQFESQGQSKNVLRFVLSDNGFQNNCAAWGKSVDVISAIDLNSKIKIDNCYAKLNKGQMELHLNDFCKINVLEKDCSDYISPKKNLSELAFNEVSEINTKVKSILSSRYTRVCKVCGNPMMKVEENYFCSVCNSEQESYAKANAILLLEDESGTTNAILTKKILVQLLNCDENELESKINTFDFTTLEIHANGYLRKNKNNESEFFVNNLI